MPRTYWQVLIKKTMEQTIIQSTQDVLKKKVNFFEQQQKERIITACKSDMKYAEVLAFIKNEIKMSEQDVSLKYNIKCWKTDGAFQFNKAVEEIFGSVKVEKDVGPSGSGNISTFDVILANGARTKVPFGRISLPELGSDSYIELNYSNNSLELVITGICKSKYQSMIDDIVDRTKELIATNSIYKNQALEITEKGEEPKRLNLNHIDSQLMVLSKQTEFDLQPLRSRILYPEKCIKAGIPLKYGCLFEGKYGTGKTLLAFKLAREATKNNWTFVYLKNPSLLAETLRMVKIIDRSCNGVIVFVEDIDQVTRGERDASLQDILNTLDGGDTKDMNVITLFTTNHIELIEPTFLRGKRIGSVITMDCLDKETALKFIKESFKDGYEVGELKESLDLIEKMEIAPAFMAEIIESIKSKLIFTENNLVTDEILKNAVKAYDRQVNLSRKKDMSMTPEKEFYQSMQTIMAEGIKQVLRGK